MNHSRRSFLRQAAFAMAGSAALPSVLQAASPQSGAAGHITGIQLYSVRADMAKDPLATLKKLAAMGYEYVEHANYVNRKFYGYSPGDFKKILDDLGLKMKSGHTVMGVNHWNASTQSFSDSWKHTVEDAATVGQEYVISPWLDASLRKTYDDMVKYMDVFNKSGELCKQSGMKFGYHNHDFEFSQQLDGQTVYEIIMKHTDPDLVIQQIDIGNLYNGGAIAFEVMKKYPGRFASMHVKDEIPATEGQEKYESTILGKGIVNVKEVLDWAKENGGTRHYIIEQESYQGISPLDCAKEDLAVMKKWGFA